MKKVIAILALLTGIFGCEQQRKETVTIEEVTVKIRFDADQACPTHTNCTKMFIRPDGSVVYDQPITIHLSKENPYQCIAHELSHVLKGQWHKGKSKACTDLP